MAEHIARVYVQQGGRTETLADLLDAAHYVKDIARATTLLVADLDATPQGSAASAVAELMASAAGDFVERFHEALAREGIIRE